MSERLAYLFLQMLPFNSTARQAPEIQAAMAYLRDYIADHDTLGGPEEVQAGFDEAAMYLRGQQ